MFTVETSAKTGSNVELAFSAITQEVCVIRFNIIHITCIINNQSLGLKALNIIKFLIFKNIKMYPKIYLFNRY